MKRVRRLYGFYHLIINTAHSTERVERFGRFFRGLRGLGGMRAEEDERAGISICPFPVS